MLKDIITVSKLSSKNFRFTRLRSQCMYCMCRFLLKN